MKRLIRSLYIIAFAIVFQNCAPSVLYLQIEEKKGDKYVFPDEITDISIFPVISISQHDSVRIVNAAFGMAEKFESDRELEKEAIGVFAVPLEEFAKIGEDLQVKDYKTYAMGLMSKTGALNQIYLHNLKLGKYSIEKYPYNNRSEERRVGKEC